MRPKIPIWPKSHLYKCSEKWLSPPPPSSPIPYRGANYVSHYLITSESVLCKSIILNLFWPFYFLPRLANYDLNTSKNQKNTCKIPFPWQSFFLQGLLSIETSQKIAYFSFPIKPVFPWNNFGWHLTRNKVIITEKCSL